VDTSDVDLRTELESVDIDSEEASLPNDRVYLIVHHGTRRDVIDVPSDGSIVIGRGETAEITVAESKVSREHATVQRRGMFLILRDLDSTNGTRLNGSVLRAGERRLASGDLIRVGSAEITVAATAGSSMAARPSLGRLDVELNKRKHAILVRIGLPPKHQAGALESMADALNTVGFVEERGEEGQYAALLDNPDVAAATELREQLQALIQGIDIGTARFPEDGKSVAELWRAAGASHDDELDDAPQSGVAVADPGMVKVFRVARRVAKTNTTVLIYGETGTGKEVLAEHVHNSSPRASKPYVRLNCASLPETLLVSELFGHERGAFTGAERSKAGYFEAASTGTLLLDEIGELSPDAQVKLLRVLENGTVVRLGATDEIAVDVRVICATHRDLEKDVQDGRFREDLYYRISTFTLRVPPLRERTTEIGLLSELFMRQLSARMDRTTPTLSNEASTALTAHDWPGNVRELRNAIEHAFVMCDGNEIQLEHLPATIRHGASGTDPDAPSAGGPRGVRDKLAQIERASIMKALADQGDNQTRAAKQLGMSRRALIYKMGKYDIKRVRS
jgi:DNA-binding NtrC family response regulator